MAAVQHVEKANPRPVKAILLIGPTGSGKSPAGQAFTKLKTPKGGKYHHFDFGAYLRLVVEGKEKKQKKGTGKKEKTESEEDPSTWLPEKDKIFVKELLKKNLLLPDDRFDIAEKILKGFLKKSNFDMEKDVLVLNGLPRHRRQAMDIRPLAEVRWMILLKPTPEVVMERVRLRKAGHTEDHKGRSDDTEEDVRRKLNIYNIQTKPLVSFYQNEGIPVVEVPIRINTKPEEVVKAVATLTALEE